MSQAQPWSVLRPDGTRVIYLVNGGRIVKSIANPGGRRDY